MLRVCANLAGVVTHQSQMFPRHSWHISCQWDPHENPRLPTLQASCKCEVPAVTNLQPARNHTYLIVGAENFCQLGWGGAPTAKPTQFCTPEDPFVRPTWVQNPPFGHIFAQGWIVLVSCHTGTKPTQRTMRVHNIILERSKTVLQFYLLQYNINSDSLIKA